MNEIEIVKLQELLAKALADADYWRLMYDKIMKHFEHQDKYIRHLEEQTWRKIVKE
jgi:hypothetical protein